MIRLTNATTDLLRVTPSGADAVKAVVSYSDKTATAYTGGTQVTAIAAASITTICGTPGASTIRDIDHVTLYCAIANTLSVGVTVSATEYMLIVAALSAGDTLEYTHAHGWKVIDSNGSTRVVFGNVTGNLAVGGTLAVTGDTTLTGDLAVNGGDLTSTASTFNLLAANATTVNAFGAASVALNIGNASAAAAFPGGISIANNKAIASGATATAFAGATTLLTLGGTGASAVVAIPGTLEWSGTTGALTVAGGVYVAKKLKVVGAVDFGSTLGVTGAVALGGATTLDYVRHHISNTFTSGGASSAAIGTQFDGTVTGAAGDTSFLVAVRIAPITSTQAATESIAYIASLAVTEPTISNNLTGGGTIPIATSVYIADAPTEGSSNYALYVASGAVGFAGALGVTGLITATAGTYIGSASTNNQIDDASNGAGSTTLYIGNASINVTSDEKLKSNIIPLVDGLSIVNALQPIEYDQDEERPWGDVRHYVGFGARHSHKIAPWAVNTQGDTGLPWKMRQEFLVAPVVRAIQQLDERVRALEAK